MFLFISMKSFLVIILYIRKRFVSVVVPTPLPSTIQKCSNILSMIPSAFVIVSASLSFPISNPIPFVAYFIRHSLSVKTLSLIHMCERIS